MAISNRRLIQMTDSRVTFRYRETETGAHKTCTLPAEEFIHRFLQHVLPKGFVKVRYYGFLGVGQRKRLAALREQLSRRVKDIPVADDASEGEQASDGKRRTELRCPACGQVMRRGAVIQPTAHSPP